MFVYALLLLSRDLFGLVLVGELRTQITGHGALRPGLEGHVRWPRESLQLGAPHRQPGFAPTKLKQLVGKDLAHSGHRQLRDVHVERH